MKRDEYRPDGSPQDTPDWLRSMKDKGEGFKVPENYFRDFPEQLMHRIREEETPQTTLRVRRGTNNPGIRRLVAWTIAAAASFLLLFTVWNGGNSDRTIEAGDGYTLEDIPAEEAFAYLLSNEESYNWQELVELGLVGSEVQEESEWLEDIDPDDLIEELDEDLLIELL